MTNRDVIPRCEKCRRPILPDAESWPGESDGVMCQTCWEDYSAMLWWKMVRECPAVTGEPEGAAS